MKDYLSIVEMPSSEAELYKIIENAFTALTGKMLVEDKGIFIDRYNKGGKSSGYVPIEFWRDFAIPMLRTRFKEKNQWNFLKI